MSINSPFGTPDIQVIAATGATAITIANQVTYVQTATTLTGNANITVAVTTGVKAGALIHLQVKTTATETFTFTSGIVAPVVTGAAGKTWTQSFWYDGTRFLPCGAKIQID